MYKLFNSLMTAILVLGSGFANAATLMCDHTEARTELAIRARAGRKTAARPRDRPAEDHVRLLTAK